MIYSIKSYVDDAGRTIIKKTSIDGSRVSSFIGSAVISTPHGPMPVEFPFENIDQDAVLRDLNAFLSNLFSIFDETLKSYVNKIIEKAKDQSRIIIPS